MQETIYATFTDAGKAEQAAGALLDNGIKESDLSVIQHYLGPSGDPVADLDDEAKSGITTTSAGDAELGAAKGAGWGLAIGAVAAASAIFVPGIGLVIGGGTLAAAIGAAASATGAGAVAGAVTGYLKDQGFEEADGVRYENVIRGGGAIIALSLPSGPVDEPKAWEIIDKYFGEPLSSVRRSHHPYVS